MQLSPAEIDAAAQRTAAASQSAAVSQPASVGFVLRKLVWAIAFGLMLLSAVESFVSFELQTGAPQQAASSAYACFRLIAVYVIARAIDELTRGKQGV